jgi:hypothetical protein
MQLVKCAAVSSKQAREGPSRWHTSFLDDFRALTAASPEEAAVLALGVFFFFFALACVVMTMEC